MYRDTYRIVEKCIVGGLVIWNTYMSCFDFSQTLRKGFLNAWLIPFTWIPSQCPHLAVKSLPYPSGFGCVIYCLAGENGQWVVKTPQFMNETGGFTRKLLNFDRRKLKHLNGFMCIHFGRVLLKTCRKGFLNERECCLLEFRRNVRISQSIDKNGWRWRY